MKSLRFSKRWRAYPGVSAAFAAAAMSLLVACGAPVKREMQAADLQRRQEGIAMWKARCEKAGVFIHKTVENVEGIYLVNVRTRINFGESVADQFSLDDPYGHDSTGDEYIRSFLRVVQAHHRRVYPSDRATPRVGYGFVEAMDPKDGKLYRYTGRVEEPGMTDGRYLKGYTRAVLERTPIDVRRARYGVQFEDLSTRQDREYWIAGSSLKVVDLESGAVLGERIGYMVDWAQGSRAGNRSPWLFAADTACPDFFRGLPRSSPGFVLQSQQTLDFVELILKTTSGEK